MIPRVVVGVRAGRGCGVAAHVSHGAVDCLVVTGGVLAIVSARPA